ncbi:MAG: ORF6N domain-containing protein [Nitrospirae bacterium]|nr:MAG: ORF6N domain-containing protein [Nitrospirota bacterium]
MAELVPVERIERAILLIRGHKVMLDADLAQLYGVTVGRLNEAIKRNRDRFPSDFMIQLTSDEFATVKSYRSVTNLKSQIAISSSGWGGRRHRPYAFTEQGVAMLSSVLASKRAIQVNIAIMRAFVKLREMVASHRELAAKLAELERKVGGHDTQIRSLFEAIRQLMEPGESKRRIGFQARR